MAIEVDIPMEIEDYKEKIIFNLSIRQLACLSSAIVLGVGSYFLCTKVFHLSMDAASYVVIFLSLPFMALGFIRKDGQPFEKYFALFLRQKTGTHRLPYIVKLKDDSKEIPTERKSKYAWIFEKEITGNGKPVLSKSEQRAAARIREAVIFTPTKKSNKRKRKITAAKIKAAKQEYRAAKRLAKKEAKECRRAEKRNPVH